MGIVAALLALFSSYWHPVSPDIPLKPILPVYVPIPENIIVNPPEARIGLPIRLKIPAIKVDANLEYVGLTPDGSVGVPKSLSNAAWFNLGPRPGETGNAIIDGHFGWIRGVPGAFNDLYKLRR